MYIYESLSIAQYSFALIVFFVFCLFFATESCRNVAKRKTLTSLETLRRPFSVTNK